LKRGEPWILFIDLDGTIWDNLDISALDPPFTKLSEDTIADSQGVRVKLYKDIVEVLKWAKKEGAIIAALSWNIPEKAIAALKAFNIISLFDYLGIESHPDKGLIASKIVRDVESRGYKVKPCRIIYIDDRDLHLKGMKERLGDIIFIKAWREFKTADELKNLILNTLQKTC